MFPLPLIHWNDDARCNMGVGNGGGGAFAPLLFQPTIYKYYLNGAVLLTMKELNFTKDVLKYRPVGTSFRLGHRILCFN